MVFRVVASTTRTRTLGWAAVAAASSVFVTSSMTFDVFLQHSRRLPYAMAGCLSAGAVLQGKPN